MRSYDEYKQILELWELGINKKAIARRTGIPRETIRYCIKRYGTVETLNLQYRYRVQPILFDVLKDRAAANYLPIAKAYSYLFGLYLGDGSIVKVRNVFRLRVTLDAKYPQIINQCAETLQFLFPDNQVGIVEIYHMGHLSCVNVSLYYKYLPQIFPQHDVGPKHKRQIVLEAWQQQIVDAYPVEFFRGLYHSDGARCRNIVNGKDYPRYQFTNHSDDIRHLFCATCDSLGIHWTAKYRKGYGETDIFISKRKDVEFLDHWVGGKT